MTSAHPLIITLVILSTFNFIEVSSSQHKSPREWPTVGGEGEGDHDVSGVKQDENCSQSILACCVGVQASIHPEGRQDSLVVSCCGFIRCPESPTHSPERTFWLLSWAPQPCSWQSGTSPRLDGG